jgi:superfamily I DNA/RNA helicase
MTDDLLKDQARKRTEYLTAILNSDSRQKLIVAGPGTGKTYTFKELFSKHSGSGDMLALTFIRKLVHDMTEDLGELAESSVLT